MRETTSGPLWMKALGAALIVSFGGMIALTIVLVGEMGAVPAILTMLPAVLALVAGVVLLTASVQVDVAERIELRFAPVWRRWIEYAEVESVRVEKHSWYRFGGVGLRWKPGATGLLLGNRPAMVIRTREHHEYVVQCRDAERFAGEIRERIADR